MVVRVWIPSERGVVIAGTGPYLIDLVCARIAKMDYRSVKTLKLLEDEGLLAKEYHQVW